MDFVKDKMVKLNKKINWYPEHIKEGRFGDWLEGVKDWSLSRFKFWGTPLPIWRCKCGEEKIIGSVEELRKNSIKKFKEYDLHFKKYERYAVHMVNSIVCLHKTHKNTQK